MKSMHVKEIRAFHNTRERDGGAEKLKYRGEIGKQIYTDVERFHKSPHWTAALERRKWKGQIRVKKTKDEHQEKSHQQLQV